MNLILPDQMKRVNVWDSAIVHATQALINGRHLPKGNYEEPIIHLHTTYVVETIIMRSRACLVVQHTLA